MEKYIIIFDSNTKKVFTELTLALKLLKVEYRGALMPIINPKKRPYLTIQWYIYVYDKINVNIIEELMLLIAPTQKYSIAERSSIVRLRKH